MARINCLFTIKILDKNGNPDETKAESIYEYCKETYPWFANEGEKGPFLLDGESITTSNYAEFDNDGQDWNLCTASSRECIGGPDREFKWLELEEENGEISVTRQTPIYDQTGVGWSVDTDCGWLMDSKFDYVVLEFQNKKTKEKKAITSFIVVEWDEDSDCEEWKLFLEDHDEYTMLDADENEITVENWRDFDHFSDDFVPAIEDFDFAEVDDPSEWIFIGLTTEKKNTSVFLEIHNIQFHV